MTSVDAENWNFDNITEGFISKEIIYSEFYAGFLAINERYFGSKIRVMIRMNNEQDSSTWYNALHMKTFSNNEILTIIG